MNLIPWPFWPPRASTLRQNHLISSQFVVDFPRRSSQHVADALIFPEGSAPQGEAQTNLMTHETVPTFLSVLAFDVRLVLL